MKVNKVVIGLLVLILLAWTFQIVKEGFKNVDYDAQNELEKIKTKILPAKAICIRGAQCQSGKCLETNNETTYGYCSEPIV